jgi:UDP-N-acetylmuramoyl-L-alanyl-D-glutamate--2,6-diaminopimelate ligase
LKGLKAAFMNEMLAKHRGVRVIVDFAHTPNALEVALESLQDDRKKGKVIVVFGCAGLRDHTKRPLMGEVASKLADLVVLTSEDPRTEDVWSIIAQIKSGVQGNHGKIVSIADRFQAIQFALLELAKSGDTVIITGKGHEKSMCYGQVEYPWSDQEAVRKIIHT